jgi:glutathione S-transferase
MLLYDTPDPAPNPRRVRLFCAAKGIALPTQTVSIRDGEHRSEAYLAINPLGQTPALELDDGTVITESIAICRYFEAWYPEPPMFGQTPLEIAAVEMWMRRAEIRLGAPLNQYWRHCHPFTARFFPVRFEAHGEQSRETALAEMERFDTALEHRRFLATDDYSMADIVLLTTMDFATFIGVPMPDHLRHLRQWHERVSEHAKVTA